MNAGLEIKELRERVQVLLEQRSRLEAEVRELPALREKCRDLQRYADGCVQVFEYAYGTEGQAMWVINPKALAMVGDAQVRKSIENTLNSRRRP